MEIIPNDILKLNEAYENLKEVLQKNDAFYKEIVKSKVAHIFSNIREHLSHCIEILYGAKNNFRDAISMRIKFDEYLNELNEEILKEI